MLHSQKTVITVLIVLTFILTAFICTAKQSSAAMTALDIIKKCDDLMRGKTSHITADMQVITPNWQRTISMENWSRGTEDFFIHITDPAREKGTTFLKKGNLLYQWLPSAEMEIKITPSMMLQSWMGSDFTNDDLVKESSLVNDYTHKITAEEKKHDEDCWKIECTPKPDAPVVWGKLIVWVRKKDFIINEEEFYNEKGELIKKLSFYDIKKANDRWFPTRWEMIPLNKPGHKTVYMVNTMEFNTNINNNIFTKQNMRKPR